jgi:hypothetical protein
VYLVAHAFIRETRHRKRCELCVTVYSVMPESPDRVGSVPVVSGCVDDQSSSAPAAAWYQEQLHDRLQKAMANEIAETDSLQMFGRVIVGRGRGPV